MSKFGAYREGMAPFVFGDDVSELIGQVVPLAAREKWLPELRVGPMVEPDGDLVRDMMIGEWGEVMAVVYDDYVKSKDIVVLACDRIKELYLEYHPDAVVKVKEGAAWALGDVCNCEERDLSLRLGNWASEYIEVSPAYCDGLKPLPVYASQGGWSYGMTLGPEHETIDFELADGVEHWRWSKAPSLSFPSLKHAMTAANAWATEAV